mgnify:CR=1 FL=1|jgi:hypothetical protein|tara:strand:- start:296 stop:463 length:168 start_codon:yes stop_codon:yes gene_type:complete
MKRWYQSKTFWLNVITFGVAAALEEPNPEILAQVLAVANIVLRFFTHQPIGTSDQ